MLLAYTLLPDGNIFVSTTEGDFTISDLPDGLLTAEEIEVLNTAFPGALRSDYRVKTDVIEQENENDY